MYPNNHYYHPPGAYPTNGYYGGPSEMNEHYNHYDASADISSYPEYDHYANTSGCGCGNGTSDAESHRWGTTPDMPIEVPGGQWGQHGGGTMMPWQGGNYGGTMMPPGYGGGGTMMPGYGGGGTMIPGYGGGMPGPVMPSYWGAPPTADTHSFDNFENNA